MNIHQLVKEGLILASDEGADVVIVLEDESGDLVAYVGNEGDYEETDRADIDDEECDLTELCEYAEGFLDEIINVEDKGVIEGESEEV